MGGPRSCSEVGVEQGLNLHQPDAESSVDTSCLPRLLGVGSACLKAGNQMHLGVFPVHSSGDFAGVSRNVSRPGADKPQLM